jgi:RTX calcium-binding nonapeptide repeat (4 copies)
LLGNEGNDWLTGGRGDDHLIGDNGNPFGPPLADTDTAVFVGKFRNYTITNNDDGTITVNDNVGNDGTDTLTNIERLQFRDRLIEVQPRTDIAADFGSAATQTIQTGASEVHSTTEQTSLTVNSIADGLSTDTVELTMFRGVTSLLPSDFHVV